VGASEIAAFNTDTLAAGSHVLSAVYGGDANNIAVTSSNISLNVTAAAPSDFQLALAPGGVVVSPTQPGKVEVTVSPVNGFNQTVSLACSNLPARAICNFWPATVTPKGSPVTSLLTLSVSANSAQTTGPPTPLAALQLSSLGILGLILRLRRARKPSRAARMVLTAAIPCLLLAALAGCSTITTSLSPGTTTTITVTATSGNLSHAARVNLTIQ
jgi:hypothetical protein